MDYNEIYHHGIKGQKWGVRRYQNKDGSLTPAGKKRQRDTSPEAVAKRKAIAKKVAVGTAMTLTVAAATVLYAKNPAVHSVVNSMAKKTVSSLKKGGGKAITKGKAFIENRKNNGFIKGVKDGVKAYKTNNPKKSAAEKGQEFATKLLGRINKTKTESWEGLKSGVKEGVKNAPKKAAETVIVGVTMNAMKRGLDVAVGKAEAERIMKANNKKKIDSFWKAQEADDDD